MTRTSTSHPIRVDWLLSARESPEIPGRLGLTFAPGKCADGITGPWQRELALDLDGLRLAGTEVLVCLLGDSELAHLGIPGLPASASAQGLDFRQFPIVDGDAPRNVARADELVETLADEVRSGRSVVVHCRGGLGRAGLIGACVLLQLEVCRAAADAIARVRSRRSPSAIETRVQERFIADFAARRRIAPA